MKLVLAFALASATSVLAVEWDTSLKPFLQLHCYDCHGDGAKKGGLSDKLHAPSVFAKWERIYDRAFNSEMPPKNIKNRPQPNELEELRLHLKPALALAHKKAKVIDLTASKSVQLNFGEFH